MTSAQVPKTKKQVVGQYSLYVSHRDSHPLFVDVDVCVHARLDAYCTTDAPYVYTYTYIHIYISL
jgi:hypothetical protein